MSTDLSNDHLFTTNPVDYFFVDPRWRSHLLEQELFDRLTRAVTEQFEAYNRGWSRMARWAFSRRSLYLRRPKSFTTDLARACCWIFS